MEFVQNLAIFESETENAEVLQNNSVYCLELANPDTILRRNETAVLSYKCRLEQICRSQTVFCSSLVNTELTNVGQQLVFQRLLTET